MKRSTKVKLSNIFLALVFVTGTGVADAAGSPPRGSDGGIVPFRPAPSPDVDETGGGCSPGFYWDTWYERCVAVDPNIHCPAGYHWAPNGPGDPLPCKKD